MKNFILFVVFYMTFTSSTHAASDSEEVGLAANGLREGAVRPNIIVIFTDDHGYADLGIQNQLDDIDTPNIDDLAKNGVRMTSGYVTAPQCTPSRAGLMTGRYQQRFGLEENGTIPLPLTETLIAQRLKKAGYVTGMTGKWDLDPNLNQQEWIGKNFQAPAGRNILPFSIQLPYMTSQRGFDQMYQGKMGTYWVNYDLQGNRVKEQYIKNNQFRLDVQTDAALAFIKRNHEKPFFFYLAYFGPHVPLEATEKYLSRFPGSMPERRRYALAMLSAIDDGVGRIKDTLKEHHIVDNTIIFFISDNGAPLKITMEDKPISFRGGAWDGSLNTPYVGEKGMLSEGGIRVPFIISWPNGLPKGLEYHKPVSSLDVAATSIAIAGLESTKELDGVNLIPFLNGAKRGEPHKALYWRFWNQSAIRVGNWKFLKAGKREFLFNVSTDDHERNNLIRQNSRKAKSMKKKLEKWSQELLPPGLPEKENGKEEGLFNYYFKNQGEIITANSSET